MNELRCVGCVRMIEGNPYKSYLSCSVFPVPTVKWRTGDCPMASHRKREVIVQGKTRVGQQKQKRIKGGKK